MEVKFGYKLTDIGVIPASWSLKTGEEITNLISKGSSPKWQGFGYAQHGMLFVTSENVRDGYLDVSKPKHLPLEFHAKLKRTQLQKYDILINLVGASIGRSCQIIIELGDANINQAVAVFRVNGSFHSGYIAQVLQFPPTIRRILEMQVDAARPNISLGDLRRFKFPLPPLDEQKAITSALNDVDALIVALDQLIAKKRDLKQAVMQQLLTGKTRLQGFSGEWRTVQVRDAIHSYFCGPSPTCEERNVDGQDEWGVLKTTAITKEDGWNWKAHKVLPKQYWDKIEIQIKTGDVLVTKAGPRHRVGVSAWVDYVPNNIIPSGKMICLRPNYQIVTPLSLSAAISSKSAQTFLDQRTTGMAESQVNFENNALLDTPIQLPTLAEQEAIAGFLSDMNNELVELEQRRDKTVALKQGMMQELLTGRTRLV